MPHRRSRAASGADLPETEILRLLDQARDGADAERIIAVATLSGVEPLRRLPFSGSELGRFVACGSPNEVLALGRYFAECPWLHADEITFIGGASLLEVLEEEGVPVVAAALHRANRPGQRLYKPLALHPEAG
ncbi:MAG: hypothetical protein ACRDNK_23120 [Solirubrobacteraceae bacterium]